MLKSYNKMEGASIELLEYVTEEGDNPFHAWLNSLKDRVARARIRVRLNRVRLGNFGDCKPVGKGVSEFGWIMARDTGCIMGKRRRP